ncbi:MAG: serine hydrolase domain-containing protein [Terriglobales bacterium]
MSCSPQRRNLARGGECVSPAAPAPCRRRPAAPSSLGRLRRSPAALCATLALGGGLALGAAIPAAAPQFHFPPGAETISIPLVRGVNQQLLGHIAPIVEEAIAAGVFPGAVILAVHRGHVIYRGAFGSRMLRPERPMRFDTIFDMASVTKVVATTPSVMQLYQEGRFRLDARVTRYWPPFGNDGKEKVTIRELLTHFSGLPPDIPTPRLLEILHLPPTHFPGWPPEENVDVPWHGLQPALRLVSQAHLISPPGKRFIYSDINFIVLGYLVQKLSGQPLNVYAEQHVFAPLGMTSTRFLPPKSWRYRIAPTQFLDGHLRWGQVQDPTATAMGGVSGLAGLFSDARDLGRYAQCLLNGGVLPVRQPDGSTKRVRILGPLTVLKMTTPQTPLGNPDIRSLGWDLDSSFSRNRGTLFPMGSFGHTGWTGTDIWIDPATQSYVIVLASRFDGPTVLPGGPVMNVRMKVANIVAASLDDVNIWHNVPEMSNTGRGERFRAFPHYPRNQQ